ncbi:MAG: aminopeptidase P family N-terminal domain-containing protein [Ruthenibacterium sp.]
MTVPEKLAALRAAMEEKGVDGVYVPSADPHMSEYLPGHWRGRAWLSGFTGSAGTLCVTKEKAALWTDGRYFIQAGRQLAGSGIELMRSPARRAHGGTMAGRNAAAGRRAGRRRDCVSAAMVKMLRGALRKRHLPA